MSSLRCKRKKAGFGFQARSHLRRFVAAESYAMRIEQTG